MNVQRDSKCFPFPCKQSSLRPGLCILRRQHNSPQKTQLQARGEAELTSVCSVRLWPWNFLITKFINLCLGIYQTLLNQKNTIESNPCFLRPPSISPKQVVFYNIRYVGFIVNQTCFTELCFVTTSMRYNSHAIQFNHTWFLSASFSTSLGFII